MTKSVQLSPKDIPPIPTAMNDIESSCTKKKRKHKKKKAHVECHQTQATMVDAMMNHHVIRHGDQLDNHIHKKKPLIKNEEDSFWTSNNTEERQKIREFWSQLGEEERRSLVKVEKEAVLRKMKEQQKHSCNCSVCGKKRSAIEDELEVLYDAYYEELEQLANNEQQKDLLYIDPLYEGVYDTDLLEEEEEDIEEEEEDDDEEEYDEEDHHEDINRFTPNYPEKTRLDDMHIHHTMPPSGDYSFGNSLTVKGGILTVADDLLKNDGKKFLDMMERLAERRMQKEDISVEQDMFQKEEDDTFEDEEEDTTTDEQKMHEGRKMFQIFAARMFEQRVLAAYREKVAQERQQRLLQELEEEERQREEREAKKQKEREKKKDKKRQMKKQQEEEKKALEAKKKAEEEALKKERERKAEEALKKERERKAEEERKRKEEERLRKEEERLRREEERLRKEEERLRKEEERKVKEEEKLRKEEERLRKDEERRKKEEERLRKEERLKKEEEKEEKEEDADRQQVLMDALVGKLKPSDTYSPRRSITPISPIGQPVVSRPPEDITSDTPRSFFSSFLFGEPSRACSIDKPNTDYHNKRFSMDAWNGWSSSSILTDNVQKLFGDGLTNRTTMTIERAKVAYQKLNEITQTRIFSGLQFHTLVQLHCMMTDLYCDTIDIRELYDILSTSNGFQCFNHIQHGMVVVYDPLTLPSSPLSPSIPMQGGVFGG